MRLADDRSAAASLKCRFDAVLNNFRSSRMMSFEMTKASASDGTCSPLSSQSAASIARQRRIGCGVFLRFLMPTLYSTNADFEARTNDDYCTTNVELSWLLKFV